MYLAFNGPSHTLNDRVRTEHGAPSHSHTHSPAISETLTCNQRDSHTQTTGPTDLPSPCDSGNPTRSAVTPTASHAHKHPAHPKHRETRPCGLVPPLGLETTFPRRDCGAGPIATHQPRGFVRLRCLPAPESAGTEGEAHLGLRGARPRGQLDPRRRQVRGFGACQALRSPRRTERRGRAGRGPGKNPNVSLHRWSAAFPALDYTSHRPPRRAPCLRPLSASGLIARVHRPLRWVCLLGESPPPENTYGCFAFILTRAF